MGYLICKCLDCGHIFDPDEAALYTDILDYIDGIAYKETYPVCPVCNGDFDYLTECEEGGEDDEP